MQKILVLLLVALYGVFCDTARACDMNEIDVLADGTNCQTAKFTITTTNLSANTKFKFYMSAMGTFYVDWGDGTIDTITRDNTDETLYSHTYTTAGIKTIRFGGLATGYSTLASITTQIVPAIRFGSIPTGLYTNNTPLNDVTPSLIKAIDGSLGLIFPTLGSSKTNSPRFAFTFSGTNIKTIPSNLFEGVTYLTSYIFAWTFSRCTALESIPSTLFDGISGKSANDLFRDTFSYCYSLRSIPKGLFANITSVGHITFVSTFKYCYNLSGYIPPSLFAGLIQNGSPYDTFSNGAMADVFAYTNLATTCPAGTVQFITGYEDYWDGHVSCVPIEHNCNTGEYLPQHWFQCEKCPENHYCPSGGTYSYSETNSNGATQCPNNLYSPTGMWESAQCGRILHIGDNVVYLRSVKKTTPALHVDIDNDGVADFFGNVTTLDVPMHTGTDRKLKLQYNGVTYSVYDDTVDVGE